ncbi:MAG: hypothetical protein WCT23_07820 [Candidatus Neomarinimicrobiota bacterium]
MKKTIFVLFLVSALILGSCSSMRVVHNKHRDKLQRKANRYRTFGAVAEIGEGMSQREDIARDKARTDAYIKIGQAIQSRIDGVQSLYIKEVGDQNKSEIEDVFEKTSKVVTNTTIQGIFAVDETILINKEGVYHAYMLYAISPRSINTKLMKELRTLQPDIYERFVVSKTYGDLEEEASLYEREILQ